MTNNEDLELINRLSRKTLSEDEVYIFPVKLCDNEVDRDNEAFTVETLKELSELFIGKTGISDHSMRSCDQSARVFKTWIEEESGRKTKCGEQYTCLKAKAYMVRTTGNEDLIKEIDAGIKKEVSVSCSVKGHTCSVCGKETCQHIRGRKYGDKLCYTLLTQATDAYEWSFVAVPAQIEAGVTKAYKREETKTANTIDIIKAAFSDSEERASVLDFIDVLEKEAVDGRNYRKELVSEVKKLLSVTVPEISKGTAEEICRGIGTDSLKELKNGLLKRKSELFPCTPQTAKKRENITQSDNDYMI